MECWRSEWIKKVTRVGARAFVIPEVESARTRTHKAFVAIDARTGICKKQESNFFLSKESYAKKLWKNAVKDDSLDSGNGRQTSRWHCLLNKHRQWENQKMGLRLYSLQTWDKQKYGRVVYRQFGNSRLQWQAVPKALTGRPRIPSSPNPVRYVQFWYSFASKQHQNCFVCLFCCGYHGTLPKTGEFTSVTVVLRSAVPRQNLCYSCNRK